MEAEELGFHKSPYGQSLDAGCPSKEAVTLGVMALFNRWQFPKKTKLYEVTIDIPSSQRDECLCHGKRIWAVHPRAPTKLCQAQEGISNAVFGDSLNDVLKRNGTLPVVAE